MIVVVHPLDINNGKAHRYYNSIENAGYHISKQLNTSLNNNEMKLYFNEDAAAAADVVETNDIIVWMIECSSDTLKTDNFDSLNEIDLGLSYKSNCIYGLLRDEERFFPSKRVEPLERTVLIVKPGFTESDLDIIRNHLDEQHIVILNEKTITLNDEEATAIVECKDMDYLKSGQVKVLLLESPDVIRKAYLLVGPTDVDDAIRLAPLCLRSRLGVHGERNGVYISKNEKMAERDLKLFFQTSLNVSRTVAIIPPQSLNDQTRELVHNLIIHNGFSILASNIFTLSKHGIKDLLPNLNIKEMDDFTNKPFEALVISKAESVKSWLTVLKKLSNILLYGSLSNDQAEYEISKLFPNLRILKEYNSNDVNKLLDDNNQALRNVLIDGFTHICTKKPIGLDAIEELANYLLANNPNKPKVVEPLQQEDDLSVCEYLSQLNDDEDVKIFCAIGAHSVSKVCKTVANEMGFGYVSSTDVINNAAKQPEYRHLLRSLAEEHKDIPASLIVKLIGEEMKKTKECSIIIDGFPETLNETFELCEQIKAPETVLFFDTTSNSDDVRERLDKLMPVINHHNKLKRLQTIEAQKAGGFSNTVKEVHAYLSQF